MKAIIFTLVLLILPISFPVAEMREVSKILADQDSIKVERCWYIDCDSAMATLYHFCEKWDDTGYISWYEWRKDTCDTIVYDMSWLDELNLFIQGVYNNPSGSSLQPPDSICDTMPCFWYLDEIPGCYYPYCREDGWDLINLNCVKCYLIPDTAGGD